VAIAPSNPQILYAGGGHPEPRYDIAAGNGMYLSDDGGAHWRFAGLAATRHIGAIVVDPHDANTVLVGALGHIFGPNDERGVFRTTDGGKTWTKTLFVGSDTGVVDLAVEPAHPNLVSSTDPASAVIFRAGTRVPARCRTSRRGRCRAMGHALPT